MKTALFIVNYNMPERADDLYEHLDKTKTDTDVFLIDNGSDITPPALHTNILLEENCQTTNGWIKGLESVKSSGAKYDIYGFLITSTRIIGDRDILKTLLEDFEDPGVVAVHPSLTLESTTNWEHLKRVGKTPRRTWMIDNIFSLWRSDYFDAQGGWDKDLIFAHGIDLELCWKARRDGRKILVDDRVMVEKITDIGYTLNRMNMSAEDRRKKGWNNMNEVLTRKYGSGYWDKLTTECTEELK